MNKPNKLYIKKPEVTEADVYYISQQENDIEQRDNTDVSLSYVQKYDNDTSRNINNIRHEVSKEYTSDTDLNETEYIKTENNDTNDLNDTSDIVSKIIIRIIQIINKLNLIIML